MSEKFASYASEAGQPAFATTIISRVLGAREMVADSDDETRTSNEPADEPARALPPPQRLAAPLQVRDPDRYDVLGEHGRGGLGKVARAHDKELGRSVAIKELIKRGDIGEIRFLREALITARLEHPSIVPIHEAGRWPDGTPFYVMKLVAGRSLKELLVERKTVEERIELMPHVVAVADAVAYAHKRKIIHRDLKPANVIVGDFGETVVIDWGLAKDLSEPVEPAPDAGPYRGAALTDLTEPGAVLGTPTYMAPEQFLGEAVDQRADVFAIGAMLWEVCSTSKVPPSDPRHRDRVLRKTGIDRDLGAILSKALAPEPDRRYRDAGELAQDLKAFTSGARVASRRYSLLGMIGHWMRRRRALATTIIVGTVIVAASTIVSVLNIASARDHAQTQQRIAEDANAELVLRNAELLLSTDPTSALAAVAAYRGRDKVRSQRLIAEARGRGVAEFLLKPHSDSVWFLAQDAEGALFTLGEDRLVRVTERGVSTTLAKDFSTATREVFAYAPSKQLLAYPTTPDGVSLLSLATRVIRRIDVKAVKELAIASDGSRLATLGSDGVLIVWNLSQLVAVHRMELPTTDKYRLSFADPATLIVSGTDGLRSLAFEGPATPSTVRAEPEAAFSAGDSYVASGDVHGNIVLRSRTLTLLARLRVCRSRVRHVRVAVVDDLPTLAFACGEGVVGVSRYRADRAALSAPDTFPMPLGETRLELDASGGRLLAAAESVETLYLYDIRSKLLHMLEGHPDSITGIAVAAHGRNAALVGDTDGSVRVWTLAEEHARVLLNASEPVLTGAFSPDGKVVAVDSLGGVVRRIHLDSGDIDELTGHRDTVYAPRFSHDGKTLLSFSSDSIRIWASDGDQPFRVLFHTHGGIRHAGYKDGGQAVVSVGDDGKLLIWPVRGAGPTVLFSHQRPLVLYALVGHNDHVIVADSDGAVWDIGPDGKHRAIAAATQVAISNLRTSSDGKWLAIGAGDGYLTIYDTVGYHVKYRERLDSSVRAVEFAPDGREFVVVSDSGQVRRVSLDASRALPWAEFDGEVRDVAYSSDRDLLAFVCRKGHVWFYSIARDKWGYVRNHVDGMSGNFSYDGRKFVSVDYVGTVVVRDMFETKKKWEW